MWAASLDPAATRPLGVTAAILCWPTRATATDSGGIRKRPASAPAHLATTPLETPVDRRLHNPRLPGQPSPLTSGGVAMIMQRVCP